VKEFRPDLIILDVMLSGANGFELAEILRLRGRTPFLYLTARTQKADKLRGLNLGADDYITKPFDLEELVARVRAVLRRARPVTDELVLGDVLVSFSTHIARRGRTDLRLTHRELEMLQYLAERRGQVVPRDELLRAVWGYAQAPFTRSVDNAIARLRKKIEVNAHRPRFIHTVHGDGYCLTPDGGEDPDLS
jgi:DNA-binding response OmpR family regulator